MRRSTRLALLPLAAVAAFVTVSLPVFSQQVIDPIPPSYIPPGLRNVDPSLVKIEERSPVTPGLATPQPFSVDVTPVFKTASPEPIAGNTLRANPGVYVFGTSNCYGLVSQDRDLMLYALRGSLFSVEATRTIKLVRGRLLSIAKEGQAQLYVGNNKIITRPHSAAIVETGPQGLVRIYALTSADAKQAAVTVSVAANETAIKLLPGQELVLATHDLSDGDLDTADGISRNAVEGSLSQSLAAKARLFEYSLAQLADFDAVFACPKLANKPLNNRLQALQNVFEEILNESIKQKDFAPTVANTDRAVKSAFEEANDTMMSMVNVAHLTTVEDYKTVVSSKEQQVYAAYGANWVIKDPTSLKLSSGILVASSKKPYTVSVADKEIKLSRNAIVLIKYQDNVLKVTNLNDLRQNSVRICQGKETIPLSLGHELIISDQAPTLSDVFDISKAGHRTTSTKEVNGLGWVTSSEVAINDLLANQPLLTSIAKNANSKPEKKLLAAIIKTAATVNTVRKNAGPFLYGQPDDETGNSKRVAARCNQCMN